MFGGARRDEEKARAKERVYSFRDEFGQWDPKNQRPELWGLYNGRHHPGEHIRVFPLSDWTELDIWQYIAQEQIEIPSIYFAHRREVFRRDGMLMSTGTCSWTARARGGVRDDGPLQDRRRHDLHGCGRVGRRRPSGTSSRRSRSRGSPSVAPPGPTTSSARPPWRTASGRATSRMELLRFATAGSVDDGKSTLIGRLLYDSKAIFEDQLEAVERVSRERGDEYTDLALLTDGLRAEREQGITIDVAYRYFATPLRKFIIADTPGHVQYTRNMVTGNSTADLTLVLVDARNGIVEQTRRHAFLASLLRVPHLLVCVNKMDLVDYDQQVFESIREEFSSFASKLEVTDLTFVPISALDGDNVVQRSANMTWYEGASLLHHLEQVYIASDRNLIDPRFPVQWVVRPKSAAYHDYRGYAGTIAGGVFRPVTTCIVVPSGLSTTITAIDTFDGPVEEAFPPMSVVMRLEEDLDISRGDVICRPHNQPIVGQDIDAMVCWMIDRPCGPATSWRSSTRPGGSGPS